METRRSGEVWARVAAWRQQSMAAISIQSLAAFRIFFGMLMAAALIRLLVLGWVDELFVQPRFHFTFPGFGWVRPWPSFWMHAQVVVMTGCALSVALGYRYRLCAGLFLLGFLHLELIDQTNYLNHYYLVTLLSGLLLCLPANGVWSVDCWRKERLRRETIPAWMLNLLRFQVGGVYFFAGVAKLNADWLWRAEPLKTWLPTRVDLALIGPFLDQTWVAYAASWTGAVFDLTIPFLLMCRRTRLLAYGVAVTFHVGTWLLFNIGLFPWIMLVSALFFFPPDWPSRMFKRLSRPQFSEGELSALPRWQRAAICGYIMAQIVIPLRGMLSLESSAWRSEGFNFAWKVMIVEKTGSVDFYVIDPISKRRSRIDIGQYLTPRQAAFMAQDPYLIRDMARRIALDQKDGAEVRADAFASLNGRASQRIVDPEVNLAGDIPANWILPLQERGKSDSEGN